MYNIYMVKGQLKKAPKNAKTFSQDNLYSRI